MWKSETDKYDYAVYAVLCDACFSAEDYEASWTPRDNYMIWYSLVEFNKKQRVERVWSW